MVFVTGDTHGQIDFLKLLRFASAHPELTKNDYVIIAGDFGAVWDPKTLDKTLKPYSDLPFTVLFVDGNHENFDLLEQFPVENWNGGQVHRVRPDILHLMRGQVFTIEGHTFFTFGGATSVDRAMREEGVSWWRQELPTGEDIDRAIANLAPYQNKVDYVITHSCGERALMYPPLRMVTFGCGKYPENDTLSYFEDILDYGHWYFGHFHMDGDLNDRMTVLYQEVVQL